MRSVSPILLLLAGCSSVERISGSANAIRGEAHALEDHGKAIGDPVVVDRSQRIYELAASIHDDLSGVQDKASQLLATLWWVAAAVVAVAVVVFVWQTGVGTACRRLLGWIPQPVARDADLAAQMMDPDSKEGVREYIAARRASDPLFDSAFRKARAAHSETKP